MSPMRRSSSVQRGGFNKADEYRQQHDQSSTLASDHSTRSTIDTFVIPGRTRYPSDTNSAPQNSFDLCIAQALLRHGPSSAQNSQSLSYPQHVIHPPEKNRWRQDGPSMAQLDGKVDDHTHGQGELRIFSAKSASGWSDFSFAKSSNGSVVSSSRDTSEFVDKYNHLAKIHGLKQLSTLEVKVERPVDANASKDHDLAPKSSKKMRLLQRLTRTSSSKTLKSMSSQNLTRKGSIGSLLGRKPKASLRCASLDDVYRLGGASLFQLPRPYRVGHLVIPTCLAATAGYLVQHGRDVSGIFRIPGQTSLVNTLYDHYVLQAFYSEKSIDAVQATIGSAHLPGDVPAGPHDVASAFKKFLWDIPGGILGSGSLFRALQNIHARSQSSDSRHLRMSVDLKARLIAYALLSLRSSRRIALISAVFGLLAFLKQDSELDENAPSTPSRVSKSEFMSSKALGVVFAPILLGDMSDQIEPELDPSKSELLTTQQSPKKGFRNLVKTPKPVKHLDRSPEMSAGIQRTNTAANIVELLVCHWEDVVRQLRIAESSSKSTLSSGTAVDGPPVSQVSSRQTSTLVYAEQAPDGCNVKGGPAPTNRSFSNPAIAGVVEPAFQDRHDWQTHQPKPNPSLGRSASVRDVPSVTERNSQSFANGDQARSGRYTRSATASQASMRFPTLHPGNSQAAQSGHSQSVVAAAWWERTSLARTHSTASGKKPERPFEKCTVFPRSPRTPTQILPAERQGSSRLRSGGNTEIKERTSRSSMVSSDVVPHSDLNTCPPVELDTEAKGRATVKHDTADVMQPWHSLHEPPLTGNLDGTSCEVGNDTGPSLLLTESDTTDDAGEAAIHTPVDCTSPDIPETVKSSSPVTGADAVILSTSITPKPKTSPSMIPRPVSESGYGRRKTPRSTSAQRYQNRETVSASTPLHRNDPNEQNTSKKRNESFVNINTDHEPETVIRSQPDSKHRWPRSATEKPMPSRLQVPLPFAEEPPVARRINFQQSYKNDGLEQDPVSIEQGASSQHRSRRPNVGTLYAEIRRLRAALDSSYEEVTQLRQQVDAMKHYRDSGTLSEQLRETDREMKVWKHRAEWAETSLFGRPLERHEVVGRRARRATHETAQNA